MVEYVHRLIYIPQLCNKCPTKIRFYPPLYFMRPWVVFLTVRRSSATGCHSGNWLPACLSNPLAQLLLVSWFIAGDTQTLQEARPSLPLLSQWARLSLYLLQKTPARLKAEKKNPVLNKLEYFKVSRHFAVLVHHYGLCDVVWDVP